MSKGRSNWFSQYLEIEIVYDHIKHPVYLSILSHWSPNYNIQFLFSLTLSGGLVPLCNLAELGVLRHV
jgi:hypothetical protein